MKKLIYILLAVIIAGGIYYKLSSNKKEMAEEAAVSEIKSQAISVALTEPKVGKIDKSFIAQGNFAPMYSLTLLSETSGQVLKVLKRKGDKVRAGELLVQVEANTMNA